MLIETWTVSYILRYLTLTESAVFLSLFSSSTTLSLASFSSSSTVWTRTSFCSLRSFTYDCRIRIRIWNTQNIPSKVKDYTGQSEPEPHSARLDHSRTTAGYAYASETHKIYPVKSQIIQDSLNQNLILLTQIVHVRLQDTHTHLKHTKYTQLSQRLYTEQSEPEPHSARWGRSRTTAGYAYASETHKIYPVKSKIIYRAVWTRTSFCSLRSFTYDCRIRIRIWNTQNIPSKVTDYTGQFEPEPHSARSDRHVRLQDTHTHLKHTK